MCVLDKYSASDQEQEKRDRSVRQGKASLRCGYTA